MNRILTSLLAALSLFSATATFAQPAPPAPPSGRLLDAWPFSGTNYLSTRRFAPLSLTNVALVPTWAGNGLQVDATNAAWINYAVVETNGHTNLDCSQGTVEMWFSPDWNSADGLGAWGTLLEVGTWHTNLATGAWGLYLSPDASNLYFSAQSNGFSTNYLSASIAWNAGDWHHLALTYSATNSTLYLEGELAATGPGISIIPSAAMLTNGFSLGSDGNGTGLLQARGIFNNLITYNYQLSADTISQNYADDSLNVYPLPSDPLSGGGFHTFTMGSSDLPSPPGESGGSGGSSPSFNSPQYGSNDFWLQALSLGTNIYNANPSNLTVILHGTFPDILYQLFSTTNLQRSNTIWTVEQTLSGSDITNFTATTVPMGNVTGKCFKALAYSYDSDGDGLPDWWEQQYSTPSFPLSYTNTDTGNTGIPDGYKQDAAGDGYNNLQKFQMGVPPGVWVTPPTPTGLNAVMGTNGNSATLTWNPNFGPVQSYTIAIYDNTDWTEVDTNVPASQTSFTDNLSNFADGVSYSIQANYAGGSSDLYQQNAAFAFQTTTLAACLVHGANRKLYLALITIPQGTTGILLSLVPNNACGWGNGSSQSETIPISAFTNNLYALSEAEYPLYTAFTVRAKAITPSSQNDLPVDIESDCQKTIRYPFLDASQVLKENLIFTMQAQPAVPTNTNLTPFLLAQSEGQGLGLRDGQGGTRFGYHLPVPVYAFASFRVAYLDAQFQAEGVGNPIPNPAPFPLHPWEINVALNNNYIFHPTIPTCWSTNTSGDSGGEIGIGTWGYTEIWLGGAYGFDTANFALNQSTNTCPSALPSAQGRAILNDDPFSPANYDILWDYLQYAPDTVNAAPNAYGLAAAGSYLWYSDDYGNQYTNFFSPGAAAPDNVYMAWEKNVAPNLQSEFYQLTTGGNIISLSPDKIGLSNGVPVTNVVIASVGDPQFSASAWLRYHLLNGSSGVYGYAEQYFDKAYAMTNGIITTNETGILSPYGNFFATQPGQVALITRTNIENGKRGTGVVNVMRLAVDANHDGTMDTSFAGPDNTSASQPFKFWVNNDSDKQSYAGDPGEDAPVSMASQYDYNFPSMPSQRDLEDWARLWICGVPALTNAGYQVTLSMSVASGNPAINLIDAVETNGGTLYLTDTNTAVGQTYDSSGRHRLKYPTVSSINTITLPASFFTNSGNKCFLFEGAGIGAGQLTLTILRDSNVLAQTSVWLDLHDVKDFYEQGLATNVTSGKPPSSLVSGFEAIKTITLPPPDETKQIIVFVHGINNTPEDYEATSATIFKRLYWAGYHGRFAAFRWPCAYLPPTSLNPYHYNLGEFYAFKAATALKNYLGYLSSRPDLSGYAIDLYAHSQGNIVTSEAIVQGATFNNYILTQGAAPAHCYDTNAPFLQKLLDAETNSVNAVKTPFYPANGGYHGYFSGIHGNLVDFYNTNDFALATGTTLGLITNWEEDQRAQKPEAFIGGPSYIYNSTNLTTAGYYTFGSSYTVTDLQEIKALVARSRSKAVGAQSGLHVAINGSVDLFSNYGFGNTRSDHSAQFARPIQTVLPYYKQMLTSFQILP